MHRITTDRLFLRPLGPSDVGALFQLHQHPEVFQFLEAPARSLEEARERWQRHFDDYYTRHGVGLLATVLKATGELIGACGYLIQEVDGHTETEIAYRLGRNFWGQGFASEAVCALTQYAFSELDRTRVIALIHPENHRSIRVAERAGLRHEKDIPFRGLNVRLHARQAQRQREG